MSAAHRVESARRYLGLELSGAKNHKTAIAALEHYPKESKIFLLEIYEKLAPRADQSTDEALLELVQEHHTSHLGGISALGVNVPLSLPPCIGCTRKTCATKAGCSLPEVKWMREQTKKAERSPSHQERGIRALEFTPYTQRPVELWVRYHVLPGLPAPLRFEIDETLGGNRAPLAARMHYLQRHLKSLPLIEAWPKLSVALLGQRLGLSKRLLTTYRQIETGAHARLEILERLSDALGIFVYERDQNKIAESLSAFDAFICALTALLSKSGKTVPMPKSYPAQSGWVEYPSL